MEAVLINEETLPEIVEDFEKGGLLAELEGRDLSFITDLLYGKYGYKKRGKLSEKQIHWVGVLYKRALGIEEKPEDETVGDLHGLIDLFTDALANLKFPKIKMEVKGFPLRLHLAGPKSKYHGHIMITDGGPYGDNKWYGTVSPDGTWTPSKAVTPELRSVLSRTLKAFSSDPKHAAMTYGHLSSNCCFCNKKLDTKESVSAGYGPVCADNWGLPWGDVK